MNNNEIFERVLVTKEEIQDTCKKLGEKITEDYKDKNPVIFLGLLKGCHPFMTDFLRNVDLKLEVDYMDVSSFFGGTKAQGEVQILKDMTTPVKDRDIIIVEDVVDSGRTIKKVMDLLYFRGAKSIEIVTMIDKPSGRAIELVPKYIGKTLPGDFIVGYGLDYKEYFRNIDVIGVPKEEVIKEINE